MAKKMISEPPSPPEPPGHLSQRSQALWRQITPEKTRTLGWLTLMQAALEDLDRADECRRIVKEEGLTSTTPRSGACHIHPLAKLEIESRRQFVKIFSALGVKWHDPF